MDKLVTAKIKDWKTWMLEGTCIVDFIKKYIDGVVFISCTEATIEIEN